MRERRDESDQSVDCGATQHETCIMYERAHACSWIFHAVRPAPAAAGGAQPLCL